MFSIKCTGTPCIFYQGYNHFFLSGKLLYMHIAQYTAQVVKVKKSIDNVEKSIINPAKFTLSLFLYPNVFWPREVIISTASAIRRSLLLKYRASRIGYTAGAVSLSCILMSRVLST